MQHHRAGLRTLLVSATSLGTLWAAAAQAQDATAPAPSATTLGDIVVTAERRASSVQSTPLAISAVSGQQLADRHISDVQELSQSLPSVNINPTLGNGRIAVRGVGLDTTQAGGEGRVAFHVDGVYYSRPTSTLGALLDVERIEVVRGPQGTLYGRNATAGAINVITADPAPTFGGYGRLTVGNYGHVQGQGAVSVPLGDDTGLRIAAQATEHDGYGRNLTTGQDINDAKTRSARVTLTHRFNEDFKVRLSSDYHRENDSNYAFYYIGPGNPLIIPTAIRLGGRVPAERRDTFGNTQQINDREFYGAALTADLDLGWATLTTVTGARASDTRFTADADGTDLAIGVSNQYESANQFSEELRLAGKYARGTWLVGAYYFDEHLSGFNTFSPLSRVISNNGPNTLALGFKAGGIVDTTAYAAFGELRFEARDNLTLVVGGRYSKEEKRAREYTTTDLVTNFSSNGVFVPTRRTDQTKSWNAFTPRVSVEYHPAERIMLYATYAEGFKSGGFAPGLLLAPVNPETLKDYEAGLKADWLDRRLRTNLAAFSYKYSNLQVSKVLPGGAQLVNAAAAELRGIELEATALPVPRLELNLTVSLLDSEYTDFKTSDPARPTLGEIDLKGNKLAQAPDYTVNAGAQYTFDTTIGAFTVRGEGAWSGRVYFNAFNREVLSQKAVARFNAFVNYAAPGDKWTVSAFARNLTNKDVVSFAYTSNPLFGTPIIGNYYPPRTFGVEVGMKF